MNGLTIRAIGSGLMATRTGNLTIKGTCAVGLSINDLPIKKTDRKFRWPLGHRPDDHPGLSDLGL